jgi:predicted nucleic acid-binding protein
MAEHEHERWASCAITENGFIRVGSRQGYPNFQPTPAFVADGLRVLKEQTAERHEYWRCDVSLADGALFDLSRLSTGRHSTDLFLAGLAYRHGGRFVTLDAKVPWQAVRGAGPDLVERIAP